MAGIGSEERKIDKKQVTFRILYKMICEVNLCGGFHK